MLAVPLDAFSRPLRRILAIGCHADDIEIGCGGTMLALTRARPDVRVTWVVLSGSGVRVDEAIASATQFLAATTDPDVRVHGFRDGFLPYVGAEVKEVFEGLKDVEPDVVFTHTRDDLHQDHRLTCELTWNTFRDHLILEYEVPKYDGDLGSPNLFVPLGKELVEEKLRLLTTHYASQHGKHWYDAELFRSVMRLRGMESATRYAEAFMCRKLSLGIA